MNFEFNFKAFLQAENEAGQQWAQLREEAEKLAALDGGKEDTIFIKDLELYKCVSCLLNKSYEGVNVENKGAWTRGFITENRTFYFWTPEQPIQTQKTAF